MATLNLNDRGHLRHIRGLLVFWPVPTYIKLNYQSRRDTHQIILIFKKDNDKIM